jgi:hypothetical protein
MLARIFHESLAATMDMAVLPGVLRCRLLRRTVQVRLETSTLRLPGGTPIFTVSRQQFMKYPGLRYFENATASAFPVACHGECERTTIKWNTSLHFEYSLQLAAGSFNLVTIDGRSKRILKIVGFLGTVNH